MVSIYWVAAALVIGGLIGCLVMAAMAVSGRDAEQEWHQIELKEQYDRGYQQGRYDEVVRRTELFGGKHEQA